MAHPTQAEAPRGRRGVVLLTVCGGAFMATLDTSIVSVALPQMARDLQASLASISWVMLAYLILNASFLLPSGRLGDLWAPGRLFLGGMALFGLASAACGLSQTVGQLIGARSIQGVGASLMLGVAPKIITTLYREGERGLPLGFFSTAFATGVTVGAPLGGWITARFGWPVVFFINLPLVLGAITGSGFLFWRLRPPPGARPRFDWAGTFLLFPLLAVLIWSLTQIRYRGWFDLYNLIALAGIIAAAGLLGWLERRQPDPLLAPALWRQRPFFLGSLAVILTFAAVMGTFFLLPFYLETIFQLPAQTSGWLLAVLSGTNALISPVGGFYADRWNNLLVLRSGSFLILSGLIALVWLPPALPLWALTLVFACLGLGFGLFQAPNLNDILRGLKPSELGLAAATNAVLKNLGALLGIALLVTVASAGLPRNLQQAELCLVLPCFQRAFGLAAGLALFNFALNLLSRRP